MVQRWAWDDWRTEGGAGIAYWGVGVTDEVVKEVIIPGAAVTQAYLANASSTLCPGAGMSSELCPD